MVQFFSTFFTAFGQFLTTDLLVFTWCFICIAGVLSALLCSFIRT